MPYTQELRLTERYSLSEDGNKLIVDYTFDDPVYYREPWTVTRIYVRSEHEIRDSECTVQDPTQAELDQ